jgi:hypothetical protein
MALYAQYRLVNGSQPTNGMPPTNGLQPPSGNQPAAVGGPAGGPGRPTALHISSTPPPPTGDSGQSRVPGPSSSVASASPPSRGLATPSVGPATPTPSASRGPDTPTPPASRGPTTPTTSPLSREVEVVLRRRTSQPPYAASNQV